jgi:hypothetical protein
MNTAQAIAAFGILCLLHLGACAAPSEKGRGEGHEPESAAAASELSPVGTTPRSAAPGWQSMAYLERLPLLCPPGTQTKQASSFAPRGGNDDGSFLRAFTKYERVIGQETEYVFFDEIGPGCLYRQQMNVWFASPGVPYTGAGSARIRFYFDNEAVPRINKTLDEFFGVPTPTTSSFKTRSNDLASYSPLPFQRLIGHRGAGGLWRGAGQQRLAQFVRLYPQDSQSPGLLFSGQTMVQQLWNAVGSDPKPPSTITRRR